MLISFRIHHSLKHVSNKVFHASNVNLGNSIIVRFVYFINFSLEFFNLVSYLRNILWEIKILDFVWEYCDLLLRGRLVGRRLNFYLHCLWLKYLIEINQFLIYVRHSLLRNESVFFENYFVIRGSYHRNKHLLISDRNIDALSNI